MVQENMTIQKQIAQVVIWLFCAFCVLNGGHCVLAQGTVMDMVVTTTVPSVTVGIGTAAVFGASSTAGTPKPDDEWSVVGAASYEWSVTAPAAANPTNDSETSVSMTSASPGTYPIVVKCTVSYAVSKADGTEATISGTSPPVTVNIYYIGGKITGTDDEHYYCGSNDISTYAYISAASGQPAGTTYSWSISGNAAYINSDGEPENPTTSTAIYQGRSPGSKSLGDVTASVTYILNGVSVASPDFPITIHVPVTFTIASKTQPTKLVPPDPDAYGFIGQSITFKITDALGMPVSGAYWDEEWDQPNGGGEPGITGGAQLDGDGMSTDNFAYLDYSTTPPSDATKGDKIYGPLTHTYSITDRGGTGGAIGCPVQTYIGIYYYTYGITGNGF